MATPQFRTYLRSVAATDRPEFLDLMRSSQALHHPWISPPLTDLSFNAYLARTQQDDHEGMLVCRAADDAIVGVINLNTIVRGSFLSATLGYYVGAPYSGLGLMREGLEQVKALSVQQLGLHRLEANIQPGNQRSIALVAQCGFAAEGLCRDYLFIDGRWRDHQRWAWIHDRSGLHR